MVEIIKNIDLIEDIHKYDVILIGTGTYHTMGNGFQRKIRVRYPETYEANIKTKFGDKNKLGKIVSIGKSPTFILCFITHDGKYRPDLNPDYLSYESLEKCINSVNEKYSGLNIATTFIGCSNFDGNGNKDKVLSILEKNSTNIKLYVYDYVQLKRNIESVIEYKSIVDNPNYSKEEKIKLINEKKEKDKEYHTLGNHNKRISKLKQNIKVILNKN